MTQQAPFNRKAIAEFYRTHTREETQAKFGCGESIIKYAARKHGVKKIETGDKTPTALLRSLAKECNTTKEAIRWRLLKVLAEEPTIARNLLDLE